MSGVRLVAAAGSAFPWERVQRLLQNVPGLALDPLDVKALVTAGKAMGWSRAVIAHHEKMDESGRCFRFEQDGGVELSGTLYPDSVFFTFFDDDHADGCRPVIAKMAEKMGLLLQPE